MTPGPICDLHCDTVLDLHGGSSLETIVDHLEHMLRLVGEDHVGFGSDFDGVPQLPHDVPDCTALPLMLEHLAARGFGDRTLRKVAWENFLRVWREQG